MTLPDAAARFWGDWVNGNQFGVKGSMYDPPNGYHHGQDVPCAAHAPVYALRGGRVVVAAAKPSTVLGYFFAIQVGPGDYDGYCHQMGIPAVGTVVAAGQQVSIAAGTADPHGSAWSGPHLHFTNGPGAYSVEGLNDVRDPRPIIKAVLAGFAGGGSNPINGDDMSVEAEAKINEIHALLLNGTADDLSTGAFKQVWQKVSDIQNRIYVPSHEFDYFQDFSNQFAAILAVLGQHPDVTLAPAQIDSLAASLKQGLGDDLVKSLAAALTKGAS